MNAWFVALWVLWMAMIVIFNVNKTRRSGRRRAARSHRGTSSDGGTFVTGDSSDGASYDGSHHNSHHNGHDGGSSWCSDGGSSWGSDSGSSWGSDSGSSSGGSDSSSC